MPSPVRTRKKLVKDVDVIDEIAGTGYEDSGREIECSVEGCEFRFVRDFDLKRHLMSTHQQASLDMENEDMDEDIEDDMEDDMEDMAEMES
jgi:general transcription factor IIIA